MNKAEIEDLKKLVLTEIKETPFCFATNGEKNYITCGKVILETDRSEEEAKKWINNKPWEAIGMMIQAICNDMINEQSNNKN